MLSKKINIQYYKDFSSDEQQYRFVDKEGNKYQIGAFSLFYPRVIKTDFSGKSFSVITTKLYKWIFMAPIPSGFFGIAGVIVLLFKIQRDKGVKG